MPDEDEPEVQGWVYTRPLPEESGEDFGRRVLAMVKEAAEAQAEERW